MPQVMLQARNGVQVLNQVMQAHKGLQLLFEFMLFKQQASMQKQQQQQQLLLLLSDT
jgi:hypothetical protein